MNKYQKIAHDINAGDYLEEFRQGDDDELYSDSERAQIVRYLAPRGLVLRTDGFGVRVVAVEPDGNE